VINERQVGNYFLTLRVSIKLKKTEYLLRCSTKKRRVNPQFHFFLGAEFVELKVFGNAELERS
jgi:hypothetical protein